MNINDIKNSQIQREKALQDVRNSYKEFKLISKSLEDKILTKKKEYCENLIIDFNKYFIENKFDIIKGTDGTITAKFKEYVITFKIDTRFSCMISTPKNSYCSIEIRPDNKTKSLIELKNEIYYNYKHLENCNSDEYFDRIDNTDTLNEINNKIKGNTNYFRETNEKFDSIIFVYSFYKTEDEFNNLTEIIEKI